MSTTTTPRRWAGFISIGHHEWPWEAARHEERRRLVEEKMKGEGWGIDRFIGAKKMR